MRIFATEPQNWNLTGLITFKIQSLELNLSQLYITVVYSIAILLHNHLLRHLLHTSPHNSSSSSSSSTSSFVATNSNWTRRYNRLESEKFLAKKVHCKVICAGGCGIAFSRKAQVGGEAEDEVIRMGWLDKCIMVRMFACTDYAANETAIENTLLLPRAVEVFTRFPATVFSFKD